MLKAFGAAARLSSASAPRGDFGRFGNRVRAVVPVQCGASRWGIQRGIRVSSFYRVKGVSKNHLVEGPGSRRLRESALSVPGFLDL